MPFRSHVVPRLFAVAMSLSLGLLAALPAGMTSAAAADVGYKDFTYLPGASRDPTQDKPQSKVWYADGSWWGGLFHVDSQTFHIYRLNKTSQEWVDTGTVIDDRGRSHGDYLFDASTNSLYVASVGGNSDAKPILVFKYTYNAVTDSYAPDPDFVDSATGDPGVVAGQGPAETVTIAKDSTGQLWITYTTPVDSAVPNGPRNVMINRSTTNEHTWGTPFVLSTQGNAISGDDISAIIAFGGNSVGVMWSDQNAVANQTFFYFASHADSQANDGTWSTRKTSASGPDGFAEDHINLKLVATNSGRILAAVKANGGPDHILLLDRDPSTGAWVKHVVVGNAGDATRPQVVVDETNQQAYVAYTSPTNPADGEDSSIYYKKAPLSNLGGFATDGLGTVLMKNSGDQINNVSLSKQTVTAQSGLLAIASDDANYFHNYLPLGGAQPARSGEFHSLTPSRILDTRNGTGGITGPIAEKSAVSVQVAGRGGVPATGASAVVLNVTVTQPTAASSFLRVYPTGAALPNVSNLNFKAGQTVPNQVTVKLGTGGKVNLYNNTGTTHVLFDVAGWYTNPGVTP